jgi:DNA repair protein RadC
MLSNPAMKDLPADQRPREKLLARGAQALADAELLALLLRTGYKGTGVVDMAAQVLATTGGFAGLLNTTAQDLSRIKGLGPAKRAELLAVMEIARRAVAQELKTGPLLDVTSRIHDYLALQLAGRQVEVFAVLFLDLRSRLIAFEELSQGTLASTAVYPREIVRRVIALNASAVVLAHNHPSGVAEPSMADQYLTKAIAAALKLIDVVVLDHVIVVQGSTLSMQSRGMV